MDISTLVGSNLQEPDYDEAQCLNEIFPCMFEPHGEKVYHVTVIERFCLVRPGYVMQTNVL